MRIRRSKFSHTFYYHQGDEDSFIYGENRLKMRMTKFSYIYIYKISFIGIHQIVFIYLPNIEIVHEYSLQHIHSIE